MSDAIRCKACRWWREIQARHGIVRGVCEIDTARYIGGDPLDINSWYQPIMPDDGGCSRGKPKTEDAT